MRVQALYCERGTMRSLLYILREKGLELVLGGLIGFIFGIIPAIVGNSPNILVVIALAALLALVIYLWVRDQRKQQEPLDLGRMVAFEKTRQGVIFTLGLRSADEGSIIYLVEKALQPQFIGFLGSPETRQVIEKLVRELDLSEGAYKAETWKITEIEEGKTKTALVIDWMHKQGLREKDIVLDITGGTVTMSVAAFMAAQERQIDCQYIQSRYDPVQNVYVKESQKPLLITNYSDTPPSQPISPADASRQ